MSPVSKHRLFVAAALALTLVSCGSRKTESTGQSPPATPEMANTHAPSIEPMAFRDFVKWPTDRQLLVVTRSMQFPSLPAETRIFYEQCLRDNTLDTTVRNNMAQALHNQDIKNPQLWRAFRDMIGDPKQDRTWRIYCIQHMVEAAIYATDEGRPEVRRRLALEVRGNDPDFSSRAMVMLNVFDAAPKQSLNGRAESGTTTKSEEAGAEVAGQIESVLNNPSAKPVQRITALGLIGARVERRFLPQVRTLARSHCPEQRVAIATLGLIGDKSDIALLESLRLGDDPLLAAARKTALARLRKPQESLRPVSREADRAPSRHA